MHIAYDNLLHAYYMVVYKLLTRKFYVVACYIHVQHMLLYSTNVCIIASSFFAV